MRRRLFATAVVTAAVGVLLGCASTTALGAGSRVISANPYDLTAIKTCAKIHANSYHIKKTGSPTLSEALAEPAYGKPIIISTDGTEAGATEVQAWAPIIAGAGQHLEHYDQALHDIAGSADYHQLESYATWPPSAREAMAHMAPHASDLPPGGTLTMADGKFRWNGKPVTLMGISMVGAMIIRDLDHNKYLDVLAQGGVNLTRVWVIEQWTALGATAKFPRGYDVGICPFKGTYANRDYNLHQLNDAFFDHMRAFVRGAAARGIVVQLSLTDRCGLEARYGLGGFGGSPYNAANNQHDFLTDPAGFALPPFLGTDGTPIGTVNRALFERIARELRDAGNVIYEIMNEPYYKNGRWAAADVVAFHQWAADVVDAAFNPPADIGGRNRRATSAPGAAAAEPRSAGSARPNILFIMSDQHSARALGCSGNAEIRTPNLDRLAAAGVRFENAITQTGQCCPARYTIWTGRYAHSHGCRWNQVVEPLEETTIMEVLREAGYTTGGFGKHHMMHSPRDHGMDVVVDMPQYAQFLREAGKPSLRAAGDWVPGVQLGGDPVGVTPLDNDHHPSGFWTKHVLDFIRQNKDRPFFVHYSFYGPHTPIIASKPWADWYDPAKLTLPPSFAAPNPNVPASLTRLRAECAGMSEEDHRRTLACYYALISQIDHNLGRVLDELERLGIADRTIVVYTADHGDMAGEQRSWTKTTANYDGTVRIPLIIRLPGRGSAGTVRRELVGLVDLMPTLCELAGAQTPEKVQGRSLVPLVRGEPVEWRETIFSEIGYPGANQGRSVMARTHTHKYIHHENRAGGGPFEELFDLAEDPWETRNEIANPEYAAVADALRAEIRQWEQTTDHAPMYPIRETRKRVSGRSHE